MGPQANLDINQFKKYVNGVVFKTENTVKMNVILMNSN